MTLLLDTHTMLWFFWDDPQLSANAKQLIVDPNNQKLVSIASIWEIAIKAAVGKIQLGEPARIFLPREIAETTSICCRSRSNTLRQLKRCPCTIAIRSIGCRSPRRWLSKWRSSASIQRLMPIRSKGNGEAPS
jgi:hypothetical protein